MTLNGLDRETRGYARVAIYSCLLNATLSGVKYFLGELSGSQALKADAVHSLADLVASLSILVGIVISQRKTRTFPHGLYKVENLVALLCSFFIFFAAYEIGREALLGEPVRDIRGVPIVIAGILAIMGSVYLFSRYELKVGTEARSPSLVADAKQLRTDLLSYLVILGGIVATHLGFPVDRYVAIFVVILIVRMGYEILVESLKVLLEATLDYQTLDGVRKIVERRPEVKEVEEIGGRNSGRFKFIEITLTTDLKLLHKAHALTEELESEILEQFPNIDRILIHYEPQHKEEWLIVTPVSEPDGARLDEDSRLAEHFGGADYFAFLAQNTKDGSVKIKEFLANPYKHLQRKKGLKVAEFLKKQGTDQLFTRSELEGKGSGYALAGMAVDLSTTDAETVGQLADELRQSFKSHGNGASGADEHGEE